MKYFERIKARLMSYSHLGIEHLRNGAILIGKAPHIAPSAWLHKLYLPLTIGDIEFLEEKMKRPIPEDYRLFLMNCSNGLKIFIDVLSLDGLREIEGRSLEVTWQPYSIITPNTTERPVGADEKYFFIGGYNWDGSLLCIDQIDKKVYRTNGEKFMILNEWVNLEEMLIVETERIFNLYDMEGKILNDKTPTIPR